jgi:mannitol-1-phosphate/altronate dehydrogenase
MGTYLGTERGRGGTEAAVADQHPKNVRNLHNHEQCTQITQLLVAVLRRRPAAGWVAR